MIVLLNKSKKSVLLLFLLLLLLAGGQPLRGDGQAWITNSLEFKGLSRFAISFQHEKRYNEIIVADPYLSNIEAKLSLKILKRTTVAFGYRREGRLNAEVVISENRVFGDIAQVVFKGGQSEWDLRLRCEYRNFEEGAGKDHWRFRLRLRWRTRAKIGTLVLKPFMALEFFGDTKADDLNRYRGYIGVAVPLGSHATWILNYIRQGTRDKEPVDVLGTGFKLVFN